MIGRGITIICLLTALHAQAADTYRIFTDTQGRSIEAQIISYNSKQQEVTIKPRGRSATTVPVTVFSTEDQDYIQEWSSTQAFLDERKLTLDFTRISKKTKGKMRTTGSMEYKHHNHWFEIEIENKSRVDLKDIQLEYVVFYNQEHHINNRSDKVLKEGTLYKKQTLDLPGKSTQQLSTETLNLMIYRESGYSVVWPDLEGEMEGVIVKMSMTTKDGKTLTRQNAFPDRFKKSWTRKTQEAQIR